MCTNTMEIKDGIHARFAHIFNGLGIKPATVAKEIGEQPNKFYNIIGGRAKPSYDTIEQIVSKYPQVSTDYLFKGIGSPILSGLAAQTEFDVPTESIDLPFISTRGYATFISCYDSHGALEFDDTYRVLLEVGDEKEDYEGRYVMEVRGNSMEPRIMDKAKLLIKPIDLINWKYVSNGVLAVLYGEYFSVKRIKGNQSIETNRLTLYSDNPESGNMEINMADIKAMFRVEKILTSPIE